MHDAIRKALASVLEGLGMFEEDYVLELERPNDPSFGDVSTNIALVLAKQLGRKPRELAGEIAAALELGKDQVESVEIAGPGFINFRLSQGFWTQELLRILEEGDKYGTTQAGNGLRVNLEFVSANPTGPFNIVSARAAAVGAALARVMAAAGYRPHTEFYCNDTGRQVELFGQSLRARYAEERGLSGYQLPEEGYRGQYLIDLAQQLSEEGIRRFEDPTDAVGRIRGELPSFEGDPDAWLELPDPESARTFGRYALRAMIQAQRETCARFGTVFDTWYLESELHSSDRLAKALERLREGGQVFELDGATWFRSTDFGDEKDRVLVKADGSTTYFLADVAYHASKQERGFELAIDFLGPDHHGHIARLKGAVEALGYESDWLEIVLLQQVNLIQDGKPLKMTKREGRLVTMDQLIDEVGVDVAKFFFLARKNNSHLDFDLDLARKESNDNPVYYVKYAHARICSVLRNAHARNVDPHALEDADLALLTHESELDLLRLLADLPDRVTSTARSREVSRLTNFATEVSAAFHQFYHQCTILGDNPSLTRARLALSRATKIVLANTLRLIGVEAPERM